MYLDQLYLVATSKRIPSNEIRLVRVSDENEIWAMSINQARNIGQSLINAAVAVEIAMQSPAPPQAEPASTGQEAAELE